MILCSRYLIFMTIHHLTTLTNNWSAIGAGLLVVPQWVRQDIGNEIMICERVSTPVDTDLFRMIEASSDLQNPNSALIRLDVRVMT